MPKVIQGVVSEKNWNPDLLTANPVPFCHPLLPLLNHLYPTISAEFFDLPSFNFSFKLTGHLLSKCSEARLSEEEGRRVSPGYGGMMDKGKCGPP